MLDEKRRRDLIEAVAKTVIAHAEELTALDSAIGDGDHGANMKRGFEAVLADLDALAGKPLPEALKAAGMQLVMKVGGASGPLYGTLFMTLGKTLPDDADRAPSPRRSQAAIEAVKARGKSDAGQKTMLDVLVPVQEAVAGDGTARRCRDARARRRRKRRSRCWRRAGAPPSSASARSGIWIRARARARSSSTPPSRRL